MLIFLRSCLFNFSFFSITILYSTALLLATPFSKKLMWRIAQAWSRLSLSLAKHICGIHFRIEGQENLQGEPCVIMAKHQSAWETIAMPMLLPSPYVWVLKRELLWIPLFGWVLTALDAIAIRRSDARQALKQVLSQGQQHLQQQRWVVLFPEGTRSAPRQAGNYQASGLMLAKRAHTDIIPLGHNAGECWSKRSFVKKPGLITLRFLPRMAAERIATEPRQQLLAELKSSIEAASQGQDS